MKPILYESTETNFNPQTRTYGLGVLSDCIKPKVVEQLNGTFELSMSYPVDGVHYSDIQLDRIILSTTKPRQERAQAFRIYEISRPINGIVSISAKHLSYDMSDFIVQPKFKNDITVDPVTANNLTEAFAAIRNLSFPVDDEGRHLLPFIMDSDITDEAEFSITQPASVRSFLGTDEGSLVNIYGGEWEFDNYVCYLHSQRGSDKGIKILYGINMTDLEQEENIEEMYTAVYPYAVHQNGSLTYVYRLDPNVPADKALAPDAPLIRAEGEFDREKVLALDVSSNYAQFPNDHIDPTPDTSKRGTTSSGKPTRYQLYNAALYHMQENNIGEPKIDLTVSFVDLWKVLGKPFFHEVDLGDTVYVYFEKLGVESTARCVKATFDVLEDRYESLELGEVSADLAHTISNQSLETQKVKKDLSKAIQDATNSIIGNNGGYVVIHDSDGDEKPDQILIMDNVNILDANDVWRFNAIGWGESSTGFDGPYSIMAYMHDVFVGSDLRFKKGFVADYIRNGTMRSIPIKNGPEDEDTGRCPLEIDENGFLYSESGTFKGELDGATGSFSGSLDDADGTFNGSLDNATGTFTGSLDSVDGTFTGELDNASGIFTGSLDGVDGTFNGGLDNATGTFAGSLDGVSGTYNGEHSFEYGNDHVYLNDSTQESPIRVVTTHETEEPATVFDVISGALRIFLDTTAYITDQLGCTLSMEGIAFSDETKSASYGIDGLEVNGGTDVYSKVDSGAIEIKNGELTLTITSTGITLFDGTDTKEAVFE